MSQVVQRPAPRAIANWLFAVAALVVAIVVVGGITRLTESGLSITEWKPVTGIVPPLTEAQWQVEFAKYQQIPEYQQLNRGMSLDAFKAIFFWEYLHRLIGRLIGMAFAIPLAWFWIRKQIPAGYKPRLLALLALGGLQGAIGWWMVKSGLSVRTDVSHIRLAIHLNVALLTLGGLVWTALDLRALARDPGARPSRLGWRTGAVIAVLAVQLVWGAFTAGLDAGYAFSSWPLMGDNFFPEGGWRTAWTFAQNAIDNPIVVQFAHRWIAFVAAAGILWLGWRVRAAGAPGLAIALALLVSIQIALGIATLLTGVEIVVAVLHQGNAALLVAAVTAAAHRVGQSGRSEQ